MLCAAQAHLARELLCHVLPGRLELYTSYAATTVNVETHVERELALHSLLGTERRAIHEHLLAHKLIKDEVERPREPEETKPREMLRQD